MLGIALVVGIMAFLVVGSLKGLSTYRDTMRLISDKMAESKEAYDLRASIDVLANQTKLDELIVKLPKVRDDLNDYRKRLQATLDGKRDPDGGCKELEWVKALDDQLGKLDKAVE